MMVPGGRRLVSALLVIGALAFLLGIVAERHGGHHEATAKKPAVAGAASISTAAVTTAKPAEGTPEGEAAEGALASAAVGATTVKSGETPSEVAAETGSETGSETSERVLGVNLESNALVSVALIASLVLAVAVWLVASRLPLLTAVAVVFTVFDIAELLRQIDRSRPGVAALAAVVAVAHGALAIAAWSAASRAGLSATGALAARDLAADGAGRG